MFNVLSENETVTLAFLKKLGVKVNAETVNNVLQGHPDWPSLLCISDSLKVWGIPNVAGKMHTEGVNSLPTPFLANLKQELNPLVIVTEVKVDTVTFYSNNHRKLTTVSRNKFEKIWTGIYLIAEPTKDSGELNFKKNRRKSVFFKTVRGALLLLALTLCFNGVSTTAQDLTVPKRIAIYLQCIILLGGVTISSILLWYEIDNKNLKLKKFCTGVTQGNCSAILNGKQANLFSWMSWSEVGFVYFTGSILILSFDGTYALPFLGWLNIAALLFTVFSIYHQWRIARQWCLLCLIVQGILVLGVINVVSNHVLAPLNTSMVSYGVKLLLFAIPFLFWYSIKPLILSMIEHQIVDRKYLKMKFNHALFETLLNTQSTEAIPAEGLGITLGNLAATNTIIKVCNPYCAPCSKAHPKIEKLLREVSNLKVQIIFNTLNNESDPSFKPVSHLMAIAAEGDEFKTRKALDDWYMAETKDYNNFTAIYPVEKETIEQSNKLEYMQKWCNKMKIKGTPTILLNGRELPDPYGIEDLQYFLLE